VPHIAREVNRHRRRMRVFDDIRQRFLSDPVQRGLHGGREPAVHGPCDPYVQGRSARDPVGEEPNRGHESEVLEDPRPQLVVQAPKLLRKLVEDAAHLLNTLAGAGRDVARHIGQSQLRGGDELSGFVVELMGDAPRLRLECIVLPPQGRCRSHAVGRRAHEIEGRGTDVHDTKCHDGEQRGVDQEPPPPPRSQTNANPRSSTSKNSAGYR
jgi:hypothetical protein